MRREQLQPMKEYYVYKVHFDSLTRNPDDEPYEQIIYYDGGTVEDTIEVIYDGGGVE